MCVCALEVSVGRVSVCVSVQVFCLEGWMHEHQCRRTSSGHGESEDKKKLTEMLLMKLSTFLHSGVLSNHFRC